MPRELAQLELDSFVETGQASKRDSWKTDLDIAFIDVLDQGDHLVFMLKRILGGSQPHRDYVNKALDEWNDLVVRFEKDEKM